MAVPKLKMNNGLKIPQIGLGLWQITNREECIDAVEWGLQAGYRHFDSAQAYENEEFLGSALRLSKTAREKVFITTKIKTSNMGNHVLESFAESLDKLRMEYVDLLLLHFPMTITRQLSWPQMETIYESGRAKSIGVSNYMIHHLEELLANCKIKPAVNQIELHVFLQMPELVEYCKKQGIVVEAYSPLAHGQGMDDPILKSIAKKHRKTTAQIMLRWCVEIGTVPLPKSTHQKRIQENIGIFDFKLDANDMKRIATLDRDMRTSWDPTHVE